MPGWQAIYTELKDQGFELISAAQDSGGEAAAGQWFDKANSSFTQIVDENHAISTLYNMTNVPTGVWIDEQGTIVRPNETAYSRNIEVTMGGKKLASKGADYVDALRDWVANGSSSKYVMSAKEISNQTEPRTSDQAMADAYFQLGVHFKRTGNEELAASYWTKAEELRPESWNYHRQDWSFTPKKAGAKWFSKFQAMDDDEEYYPTLELD